MNSVTRKVEVTQDDIGEGCRFDTNNCPVARAIKRTFPEFDEDLLVVHEQEIIVSYKGWCRKIAMPEHVEQWIRNYDYAKATLIVVSPISFDLTVVI